MESFAMLSYFWRCVILILVSSRLSSGEGIATIPSAHNLVRKSAQTDCVASCTVTLIRPKAVVWSSVDQDPLATISQSYIIAGSSRNASSYDTTVTLTVTILQDLSVDTTTTLTNVVCGTKTTNETNANGIATTAVEPKPGMTTTLVYPTQMTYLAESDYIWSGVLPTGSGNDSICASQSAATTVQFPSDLVRTNTQYPNTNDLSGSCYTPVLEFVAVNTEWFASAYPSESALQGMCEQRITTARYGQPKRYGRDVASYGGNVTLAGRGATGSGQVPATDGPPASTAKLRTALLLTERVTSFTGEPRGAASAAPPVTSLDSEVPRLSAQTSNTPSSPVPEGSALTSGGVGSTIPSKPTPPSPESTPGPPSQELSKPTSASIGDFIASVFGLQQNSVIAGLVSSVIAAQTSESRGASTNQNFSPEPTSSSADVGDKIPTGRATSSPQSLEPSHPESTQTPPANSGTEQQASSQNPEVIGVASHGGSSTSEYIVNGQTIVVGGPTVTVGGNTYEVATSGDALVVNGVTSQAIQSSNVGGGIPIIAVTPPAGSRTSEYIIAGQTVAPGSPAVISGTTYAAAQTGDGVLVNNVAYSIAQDGTIGGAAAPVGTAAAFAFNDKTIIAGGQAVVEYGTTYSLAQSGGAVVVNGLTSTLSQFGPAAILGGFRATSIAFSAAESSHASSAAIVFDGQTLIGGSVVAISGTTYSLAQDGSDIVVNGITSTLAPGTTMSFGSLMATRTALPGASQVIVDLDTTYTLPTSVSILPSGGIVIDSQTLLPGSTIIVDGKTLTLDQSRSVQVAEPSSVFATDSVASALLSLVTGTKTTSSTRESTTSSQTSTTGGESEMTEPAPAATSTTSGEARTIVHLSFALGAVAMTVILFF